MLGLFVCVNSSVWLRTWDLSLFYAFLKLVQEVQVIQCELIQLKIVTWIRLFLFYLEKRTGRFLGWTGNGVSLYFGARGGADLFSEIERGADGLDDFGFFRVDFWELHAFANWYIGTLPDRPSLDDFFDFLFLNHSVLALDVDYLMFYVFGFLSFIF
jgi:hypothetical protein